jgi:hypothetical protein
MIQTLPWFAAAVLWTTLAYQLRAVRRRTESPVPRWLALSFAALAVALTLNLQPVYFGFDRLVGEPNFGELVVHGLVLVAAWSAKSAIVHFHQDSDSAAVQIRRRALVLSITLVAMITFFILAPVDVETTEFTTTYAAAPYVPEYWIAYLGFLGFALGDVARMNWRYAGPPDLLRAGLRLLALGATFGLVYVIHKAGYVGLRRWSDLDLSSSWHATVSRSSMVLCVVLAAVGTTLPRWGPWFTRLPRQIGSIRTYRRLGPLWSAVQAACPDLVLLRPRHPRLDSIDPRDIDFRLYRRVIEIRDGEMELRRFVAQSDVEAARREAVNGGLTGRALAAAVEAASMRAALRGVESDRPATAGPRSDQTSTADLDREIDWLLQVADHFARSGRTALLVARADA